MHRRGEVIGQMRDIRVDGDDITGEPWFDEVTDESKLRKQQWDAGSLQMVSANFDIIKLSDNVDDLLPGQCRPTVTESKLVEVSIVDIGGNDDAIVLTHEGKELKLAAGVDNADLPLLNIESQTKNELEMDFKAIALKLGLPEAASEQDILNAINVLLGYKTANETLRQEKEQMQLSAITQMVGEAKTAGKFPAEKEAHFIELGKKVGVESLKLTLDSMSAAVKPTDIINQTSGAGAGGNMQLSGDWKKLSDVPGDKLAELRESDKPAYMRLYKAEYGIDCPKY